MQAFVIVETKGKQLAWTGALKAIGFAAEVLATHGVIKSFPSGLWPLGIAFSDDSPCDPGRVMHEARFAAVLARIAQAPEGSRIFIATDDDAEGDVAALDLIEALLAVSRSYGKAIFRVRTRSLTSSQIKQAIERASPLLKDSAVIIESAIPGRVRALTDRWIGAVFSKEAAHPVGRLRTSVLGSFFLLEKAQQHLRGRPETGEIILRARSSSGGLPFVARVALDGSAPKARIERLHALAEAHAGRMVPGAVLPRRSLSAAVTGRIGKVRPFSTGDAITYAMRHFRLTGAQAMTGLQGAYLRGMLSFPKTDSRNLSREAAAQIVRLGEACKFSGLDVTMLSQDGGPSLAENDRSASQHSAADLALHPVCPLEKAQLAAFDAIIRSPIRFGDMSGSNPAEIEDIMIAIVSRRCLEAARDTSLEVGDWRPDNEQAIAAADAALLGDLEWLREVGAPFPWSKDMMTGTKIWPLGSVILSMMLQEGLGRPSSYGYQADMMAQSGELADGDLLTAPRPSALGQAALSRSPRVLWLPATCRMIEAVISNRGDQRLDDKGQPMQLRMKRRVAFWLKKLPEDVQAKLIRGIDDPGSITAQGPRLGGRSSLPDQNSYALTMKGMGDVPSELAEDGADCFGIEQICI